MNEKKMSIIALSLVPNIYILKVLLPTYLDLTVFLYVILFFVCVKKIYKNKVLILNKIDALIALWMLILLLSLFYSSDQYMGLIRILQLVFLGVPLIYFSRFIIRTKSDFLFFVKASVINSTILQSLVIGNFIIEGMQVSRFEFYGLNPLVLGMIASLTIIFVFSLFAINRISYSSFTITMLISTWTLLLSGSQGPLLSTIAGLLILLPLIKFNLKKITFILIFSAVTAVFFLQINQFTLILERVMEGSDGDSISARLQLYSVAVDIIRENPLVGAGIGIFGSYYPHNLFLEIYAEGGILLLLILLIAFILITIKLMHYFIFNRSNFYLGTSLAITIASITALLFSFTYINVKFLWISLGLLLVVSTTQYTYDLPDKAENK
ncbi:O-antigen ligase family protein [Salicibibacter cibi]|uniref:O-antigen ligase family protein n=1 Tax=Salicibibacter cibi TaxID=2743001 RepID=A0A7T7CFS0_9BACI|nr:O-antigen ligase family protein [Salicibibacter cibi]QQK80447.1 O-antigen ligase family protein [Salicibibacter cibi]